MDVGCCNFLAVGRYKFRVLTVVSLGWGVGGWEEGKGRRMGSLLYGLVVWAVESFWLLAVLAYWLLAAGPN